MRAITVLAGGWSAGQVDLHRLPGFVIAVNDSAIHAPHFDAVVSMDRLWAEHRYAQVSRMGRPVWLRRSTLRNVVGWDADMGVTAFENDHRSTTLSDVTGTLNGTHSGFCALNLAYQMRPTRLYLVGFDSALGPKGERHWFPDYPWKNGGGSKRDKLVEWSRQYAVASTQLRVAGVEVFHHSLDPRHHLHTHFKAITTKELTS